MSLAALYLRRREERRLQKGHPWVFSNEVAVERSPLTELEPGQFVNIHSHSGKVLGTAYVNPHSLICARLVSRRADRPLTPKRLRTRLARALALRKRLGWLPDCRLVYGESDGLPGLVVDGYAEVLAVQLGTAGMQGLSGEIVDALDEVFEPRAMILRNDMDSRALEGLETHTEVVKGEVPEEIVIRENRARFRVSPLEGQKTGWYYDQRSNRALFAGYAAGMRVLDGFSYAGGFGVQAAVAGASSVLCLDSSQPALDQAEANAALNDVGSLLQVRRGDVFDTLRALHAEGERFDLVVMDPPAFIRRKKDVPTGTEGYRRLNRLAMQVLNDDGLLLSASCSYHLRPGQHRALVASAANGLGRSLQILNQGHQAADHPVHPWLSESEYLKAVLVRVFADG
jgi:23S rRNA (cytosine1962-C5)-methyltransferase